MFDIKTQVAQRDMDIDTGWKPRESYDTNITIVTALFNGQQTGIPHSVGIYTPEWVDKLYRGIARNLNGSFDFICLTDQNYRFKENVRGERFERSVDQYGWMSLMELWRPDLCKGRRVTMGLDTIITGPLDDIFSFVPENIACCSDPRFPRTICNAITIANKEFCEEWWHMWISDEHNFMSRYKLPPWDKPSEMVALREHYGDCPRLDWRYPGTIFSYKDMIQKNPTLLHDSSIVYFHGDPKPHQIKHLEWVRNNWK